MYTLLMDERRTANKLVFVYAGVIVRTGDLPAIQKQLEALAVRFAGSAREQLKYVPDERSAQKAWCAKKGLSSNDAKQAVLDVITSRARSDAVVIAGIVIDPRGEGSSVTEAQIYSWVFDAMLQRYGRFLTEHGDRRREPLNEVVADTLSAEASIFHRMHADAWHDGWPVPVLRWPLAPLKELNCRPKLLTSMARYAPALWLADHVAGALGDWVRVEWEIDRAPVTGAKGPRKDAVTAARARVRPVLSHVRRPAAGGGLVPWPRDLLDNSTLTSWVLRTGKGGPTA